MNNQHLMYSIEKIKLLRALKTLTPIIGCGSFVSMKFKRTEIECSMSYLSELFMTIKKYSIDAMPNVFLYGMEVNSFRTNVF